MAEVVTLLHQPGAIDLAAVISLTSSEIDALVANGTQWVPVLDVFEQTLRILAEGIFSKRANVDDLPPDLVAQLHEIYLKFEDARLPDSLKERLRYIIERLPSRPSYLEETEMAVPSPELEVSTFGPSQPSRFPVPTGGAPDTGFVDASSSTPTRD
ncbi:hypothetical protein EI94DRAFT_1835023 [Lactarius quietus]|nr:hypothetical protein EI94DRAFT_1835023 [Lactarius quietus]